MCLGISILEDSVPEEDETFQVVVAGLGIVTEVKILDDDGECGQILISQSLDSSLLFSISNTFIISFI